MRTVVLSALLAVGLSGAARAQTPLPGDLGGTVRDAATGQPLAGATVVVDGTPHGAATGADGRFVVRGLAPGPYALTVRSVGYEPFSLHALVDAGATRHVRPALTADASAEEIWVCCAVVMDRSPFASRTVTRDEMRRLPVER